MGEKRAIGESILGDFAECVEIKSIPSPVTQNSACLYIFIADILKYVHTTAFDYNKCRFNSTLEAALMEESGIGEINS